MSFMEYPPLLLREVSGEAVRWLRQVENQELGSIGAEAILSPTINMPDFEDRSDSPQIFSVDE
jgi:hypothetical protein